MPIFGGILLALGIFAQFASDHAISQNVSLHKIGWAAVGLGVLCLGYALLMERTRSTVKVDSRTRREDVDMSNR